VLANNFNPGDDIRGTLGFAVEGIEVYLPISHELTLGCLCPTIPAKLAAAKARIRPGDVAVVIGAGPIGLSVIEFVKLTGARTIVLDMNRQRLEFCHNVMKVDETIEFVGDGSELKRLEELTDGALPTVVIDAGHGGQFPESQLRRHAEPNDSRHILGAPAAAPLLAGVAAARTESRTSPSRSYGRRPARTPAGWPDTPPATAARRPGRSAPSSRC
jgi:threonine dehydrogenase-like Zn-dependent dehydrogenase